MYLFFTTDIATDISLLTEFWALVTKSILLFLRNDKIHRFFYFTKKTKKGDHTTAVAFYILGCYFCLLTNQSYITFINFFKSINEFYFHAVRENSLIERFSTE
jgi:hypothetical protein